MTELIKKTTTMGAFHKRKKIAVLIPCYNEEGGIGDVLKGFPVAKAKANPSRTVVETIRRGKGK